MNQEKVKMILNNMSLLLDSLYEELIPKDHSVSYEEVISSSLYDDYDEVFEE